MPIASPHTARARRDFARCRNERGQSTVEFAFVVPMLCALILALVDFAMATNAWLDMTHVANMGARLAAVGNLTPGNCANGTTPSPNTLQKYILCNAATKGLQSGGTNFMSSPAKVCISFPNATGNVGDPVKVTVTANYQVVPFAGLSFPLKASSTMRLEQAVNPGAVGCTS